MTLLFLLLAQDVVTASARGDAARVAVTFAKPVEAALLPAQFSIEPGVKVLGASRGLDLRTVTLATTPLAESTPYVLTVKGVKEAGGAEISATVPFTFVKGLFASAPREEKSKLPKIEKPVAFHTPEADAILSALQVFPKGSPWNEDISKRPVHPESDRIVAFVGRDKPLRPLRDMGFVIVPPGQARIDVKLLRYAEESDKGPYPLPPITPIEGWPMDGRELEQAQASGDGDRHGIVIDPHGGMLYEFYRLFRRPGGWEADGEATWDLRGGKGRPRGWTSADAAGLPIFPSLPRFDECERGVVTHALRMTVRQTRREFLPPASHHAGSTDAPEAPAMGQRFRLKAGVDLSGLSRHARAVALAMKKHGLFVADNGSDWDFSAPPDPRLQGLDTLRRLKGSDFEVVGEAGSP